MRKLFTVLFIAFCIIYSMPADAKQKDLSVAPPFRAYVLADGFDNPWDITYGPDDMLWVTERTGKKIVRVEPKTGNKKTAVTIADALAGGGHQGILGMALAPDFLKSDKNFVYVLYTYKLDENSSESVYKKFVRYEFDVKEQILKNPVIILEKLPAGDDHNGGRVIFGPDGMIYITFGELGHNQFANFRKEIHAQMLPTANEVASQNWRSYVGKVLRIMPDGSIPADNPVLKGVISHVFTYGHRNPQGITFAGDVLLSCEHGPSSDDELNLLESGGNYGWPHVAGFRDNMAYRYANWSKAPDTPDLKWDANVIDPRVPVQNELDWKAPVNYKDPLKTFFTVRNGYNYHDGDEYGELGYAQWPTIGPSSVMYYPKNGPIKGWTNSAIITTLKNGTIYRVNLTSDMKNVQGDIATFFHMPNRYRDICMNPEMTKFYVITDSVGTTKDYTMKPTDKNQNPGAIIVFEYFPEK